MVMKKITSYRKFYLEQGHTLLETLFVVTIIGIIFLAAIPNIRKLLVSTDQTIALDRLKNAIELAKSEAYRKNTTMTLCPSHNQNTCSYGDNWEVGFILFENPKCGTQPSKDAILQVFSKSQYGKIIYDAMGNQLNIYADGTTTNIGNFIYCAKEKGLIKPKGLVLNWVARVYSTDETPDKNFELKCGY